MTDAEWNSWQSTWKGAMGPLPDVHARTRREVRRHLLANVAFFLLVAVAVAAVAHVFSVPDREPWVHLIGWIILAFFGAMSIGYLWIQRGIAVRATGNPRAAVAFLERRLHVERFVAHLVRWAYLGLCVAFALVFPRLVADHQAPKLEMAISFSFMAIVLGVTFSAPWWVARRNRPYQEEIDRWRRWMDEQSL